MKYIMKDEPNSQPFQSLQKAVVDNANDEDPIRKLFAQLLIKTISSHDLSRQECFLILNKTPLVDYSRGFVTVNVLGTRRVTEHIPMANDAEGEDLAPARGEANDTRQLKTARNVADNYWNRLEDPAFVKACEEWDRDGPNAQRPKDPRDVSLYEYVSHYDKKWKYNKDGKTPHVTPNFNRIPNKQIKTPV